MSRFQLTTLQEDTTHDLQSHTETLQVFHILCFAFSFPCVRIVHFWRFFRMQQTWLTGRAGSDGFNWVLTYYQLSQAETTFFSLSWHYSSSDEIIRNFFSVFWQEVSTWNFFQVATSNKNKEPPLHCIQECHPRSRERYRTSRDERSPTPLAFWSESLSEGVLPGTAVIGVDGESPCPSDRWCLEPDSQELPATAPPYFRLSSDAVSTVYTGSTPCLHNSIKKSSTSLRNRPPWLRSIWLSTNSWWIFPPQPFGRDRSLDDFSSDDTLHFMDTISTCYITLQSCGHDRTLDDFPTDEIILCQRHWHIRHAGNEKPDVRLVDSAAVWSWSDFSPFDDVSSTEMVFRELHGRLPCQAGNVMSQTTDLLTLQSCGYDRTFDDDPTDEIIFCQRHWHMRQGMRSQTFDLLTPQPFGRDPTFSPFDDVFSDDFFFPCNSWTRQEWEARCLTCWVRSHLVVIELVTLFPSMRYSFHRQGMTPLRRIRLGLYPTQLLQAGTDFFTLKLHQAGTISSYIWDHVHLDMWFCSPCQPKYSHSTSMDTWTPQAELHSDVVRSSPSNGFALEHPHYYAGDLH